MSDGAPVFAPFFFLCQGKEIEQMLSTLQFQSHTGHVPG